MVAAHWQRATWTQCSQRRRLRKPALRRETSLEPGQPGMRMSSSFAPTDRKVHSASAASPTALDQSRSCGDRSKQCQFRTLHPQHCSFTFTCNIHRLHGPPSITPPPNPIADLAFYVPRSIASSIRPMKCSREMLSAVQAGHRMHRQHRQHWLRRLRRGCFRASQLPRTACRYTAHGEELAVSHPAVDDRDAALRILCVRAVRW